MSENKSQYIEIAKYKLKPGVTAEAFLEAERNVRQGIIGHQPGFLGRELGRGENDEWVVILRFDQKANFDAFLQKLNQDPAFGVYGSLIDFSTMRMEFFDIVTL